MLILFFQVILKLLILHGILCFIIPNISYHAIENAYYLGIHTLNLGTVNDSVVLTFRKT